MGIIYRQMVLKRVLWLAIFVALFIVFRPIDGTIYSSKSTQDAQITILKAVVYNIGDDYLKMQADKISRYSKYDTFEHIRVEFLNTKNETYTIQANKAVYKNKIINFSGNVVCKMSDNRVLKTQELTYNQSKKQIYSNKAFALEYITHTLKGSSFVVNYANNTIDATDTKFVLKVPKTKSDYNMQKAING